MKTMKRLLPLLIALSLFGGGILHLTPALAAVAVDATNKKTQSLTSTSVTIASGDNLLVVTFEATNDDVATLTYNGTTLTQLGTNINFSVLHQSIWYMINPPVGTATLAMTTTNTFTNVVGIIPISGAATSSTFGTVATASSSSNNNPAVTATGGVTNGLYIGIAINGNTSQTSGGSQASIFTTQFNGSSAYSVDSLAGSGSGAYTWTGSATGTTNFWSAYAVAIAPASAPTTSPKMLLLGVN